MMMKLLFLLLTIACLPAKSLGRCSYGCTCYNDDSCEYYCANNMCQNQLPYASQCTGYYLHPRECGSLYYCDTTYSPAHCASLKNDGEYCRASYSCLSGYCDFSRSVCGVDTTYYTWMTPVIVSCVVSSIILFTVLLVIIRIRRRRRFALTTYQVPSTVVPTPGGIYPSYQNPCLLSEGLPPKYPGPMHQAAHPHSYQNPRTFGEAPYSQHVHQTYPTGAAPSYQSPNVHDDVPPPAYSGPTNAGTASQSSY